MASILEKAISIMNSGHRYFITAVIVLKNLTNFQGQNCCDCWRLSNYYGKRFLLLASFCFWFAKLYLLDYVFTQSTCICLGYWQGEWLTKGAFFNYVDKILAFFDHLHTYPGLTFVKKFLYCYKGKSAYRGHFQYQLGTFLVL